MTTRLNPIVLSYVLPKSCSLTFYEFSKSLDSGEYDIFDASLFLQLLNVFENFLKTFNFKILWNLMPVKSKPHIATYHSTSLCSFCNQQDETESHFFCVCVY